MAKRLFLIAAGAIALTACTSQDVLEDVAVNDNAIRFQNVVSKHTRADAEGVTELDNSTLEKFHVFGFYTLPEKPTIAHQVFDNVAVTTEHAEANNTDWKYEGATRYWVKDAKYYFYAYSCGNISKLGKDYGSFTLDMEDEKDASERTLKITDYLCNADHQHDLVFASDTEIIGKDSDNEFVSFQFRHILSKIKAKFSTEFPSEYDVVISNVKISGINNCGDYVVFNSDNVSNTGWTNVGKKKAAEGKPEPVQYIKLDTRKNGINGITVTNKIVDNVQMTEDTAIAFAIPFEYPDPLESSDQSESSESSDSSDSSASSTSEVRFTFDVQVNYKGEFVLKKEGLYSVIAPNWQPGHAYVYNVNISPANAGLEEIKFSTSTDEFSDWLPADYIDVGL